MAFLRIVCYLAFISVTYGCGKPAITPVLSRIIQGQEALPHSWPWQVSLQRVNGFHFCGGSLIAASWVLTAAVCEVRLDTRVVVGAHNKGQSSMDKIQILQPQQVFIHMINTNKKNAISLIKLVTPATLNSHVSLICLPDTNYQPFNMECITTGWGVVQHDATTTPDVLQQAYTPVLDEPRCRSHLPSYDVTMICAGANGSAACKGDSGSPLVCQMNSEWTLAGIVSWGNHDCPINLPAVYIRVSAFRDWIDKTIAV